MSETAAPAADPGALIRSKSYRVLLVFAALIGVLVSFASWCFLELVHWIQQEVYKTLPSGLGLHPVPWWWPLPVLAIARVLTAAAIMRLPGRGGHIPYEGIKAGTAKPWPCWAPPTRTSASASGAKRAGAWAFQPVSRGEQPVHAGRPRPCRSIRPGQSRVRSQRTDGAGAAWLASRVIWLPIPDRNLRRDGKGWLPRSGGYRRPRLWLRSEIKEWAKHTGRA